MKEKISEQDFLKRFDEYIEFHKYCHDQIKKWRPPIWSFFHHTYWLNQSIKASNEYQKWLDHHEIDCNQ